MSNKNYGLLKCNPLCYFEDNSLLSNYCTELCIFNTEFNQNGYLLDIKNLLEQIEALYNLANMTRVSDISFETFEKSFKSLLNILKNTENEEEFWDNFEIFFRIIMNISYIKECRSLIMQSIDVVIAIVRKAARYEKAYYVENKINANYLCYQILAIFLDNKFREGSECDDDLLVKAVMQKVKINDNKLELLELLSVYKNCGKYDISIYDLITIANTKYFEENYWMYIPYLIRYRDTIIQLASEIVLTTVYDYWFGYCLSNDMICASLTGEQQMDYVIRSLEAFKLHGVYTYEVALILNKFKKEVP